MSQFAANAVVYEYLEEALPYRHKHRLFPNRFVLGIETGIGIGIGIGIGVGIGIACKALVASGCFAAPGLKPET